MKLAKDRSEVWRSRALYALPFVLFVVVGLLLFPSTGRDDKYISFWPAFTLAEYGEMLNYNFNRVEQSSTLLLVLLVAGMIEIGFDPVFAGWLLSLAGGLGSVYLAGRLARRVDRALEFPAMIVTSQVPCLVYWAFGGMEATLASVGVLLLAMALVDLIEHGFSQRRLVVAFASVALFSLVRPEAPLVALAGSAAVLVWLVYQRIVARADTADGMRVTLVVMFMICVVFGGVMMFRQSYFGSPFPQPVSVKHTGGGLYVVRFALQYILRNALILPFGIVAAIGVVRFMVLALRGVKQPMARGVAVAFAAAYLGFLLSTGGDWMEGGRFLVPFLPLSVVIAVDLCRAVLLGRAKLAYGALTAAGTAGILWFAATRSIAVPLWVALGLEPVGDRPYHWLETIHREHRRDMYAIDAMHETIERVRPHTNKTVNLFAHNVGMIVYHTVMDERRHVRVVDMRGLSDRYISESPLVRDIPRSVLGIEVGAPFFITNYETLRMDTGAPFPAVMLTHLDVDVDALDYVVAFDLTGHISSPPPFAGRAVPSSQRISVHRPLSENVGAAWPIAIDVTTGTRTRTSTTQVD